MVIYCDEQLTIFKVTNDIISLDNIIFRDWCLKYLIIKNSASNLVCYSFIQDLAGGNKQTFPSFLSYFIT